MTPVLHMISDRDRHQLPLIEALSEAAEGGADVIQIRDKKMPVLRTLELVKNLKENLNRLHLATKIFVNDRMDLALAEKLDGVHLAAQSLPVATAHALRNQLKWQGMLGCSVHSLEEAMFAENAGADYVTFGHVFPSASHPQLAPRGLAALSLVVEKLSIPVLAIGGIDEKNVESVLATGCSGVAVIGAVLDAENPKEAAYRLKQTMLACHIAPKTPFFKKENER